MLISRPIQKAVDRLIAELRNLSNAIQEHAKGEHERQQPNKEQQAPSEVTRIRNAAERIAEAQEAPRAEKKWYKDRTHWVAMAGIAVVAVYTSVAYLQWDKIRQQVDIERKAQRPWVGIAPGSISARLYVPAILPETMDERRLVVEEMLENSGNSVALNVFSDFDPVWDSHPKELRKRQDGVCRRVNEWSVAMSKDPETYGGGSAILPHTKLPWERNKSNVQGLIPADQPVFHIYLVGCTVYREPDGTPHTTRWCATSPAIKIPTSDDDIAKSLSGDAKFTTCPVGVGEYAN